MQVGPVDWTKFKSALDWAKTLPSPGRSYSRVYRMEQDPNQVLVIEEWDSHEAFHKVTDQVGDEFNRRAGTEGMHWETGTWELADSA
jgi:hypothetical protein